MQSELTPDEMSALHRAFHKELLRRRCHRDGKCFVVCSADCVRRIQSFAGPLVPCGEQKRRCDRVKYREITTFPGPIGSEHAVRTLRIQAAPRAVFGLPKRFAVRAPANQNPRESTPTRSPATMRCLRKGEPQRNNLDAE